MSEGLTIIFHPNSNYYNDELADCIDKVIKEHKLLHLETKYLKEGTQHKYISSTHPHRVTDNTPVMKSQTTYNFK